MATKQSVLEQNFVVLLDETGWNLLELKQM